MASEDDALELDVEQPATGGSKKLIIIIAVIVLLNAIGGATWFFLQPGESSGEETDAETSDTATVEEVDEGEPVKYLSLKPEFVVNFGPGSKVKYLQIEVQVATRIEKVVSLMTEYNPVIRNDILFLLSAQNYENLSTRPGKEALRRQIVTTINKVLNKHMQVTTKQDKKSKKPAKTVELVENIYFTNFIMQ